MKTCLSIYLMATYQIVFSVLSVFSVVKGRERREGRETFSRLQRSLSSLLNPASWRDNTENVPKGVMIVSGTDRITVC